MKLCKSCGITKPHPDFSGMSANKDGLHYYCKSCAAKRAAAWRDKNRDHRAKYKKLWNSANPQKVRAQRIKNSMRSRETLYGISKEQYEAMLVEQNGRCAISNHAFERDGQICVDHDHVTGEVRGLLCTRHNLALGLFEDCHDSLIAAAEYVSKKKVLA